MRVSVIVPVFNESAYIEEVLGRVLSVDTSPHRIVQVIVADDASTDDTFERVSALASRHPSITPLRLPRNSGKGSAIREALKIAIGEIVLIQDADLEYDPADYPALLAPFEDPAVSVVYGSRFRSTCWPEGMRVDAWIANRLFSTVASVLYWARITDEGTAYKLFRREVLLGMGLCSKRFEFCPEVTAKLLKRGTRIKEVPVSYSARTRSEGKKPGYLDGLSVLWTLLKYRFLT